MSAIYLVNAARTNGAPIDYETAKAALELRYSLNSGQAVTARYAAGAGSASAVAVDMDEVHLKVAVKDARSLAGVTFRRANSNPGVRGPLFYRVRSNGEVQVDPNINTGIGTVVGVADAATGSIKLTSWPVEGGGTPAYLVKVSDFSGIAAPPTENSFSPFGSYEVLFRTATSPLRPQGFSVLGTLEDGATFNVSADANGVINTSRVKGRINYSTGVVTLLFVFSAPVAGGDLVDISFLGIAGVSNVYLCRALVDTIRYNAVAYTYLPLDATLLGIDPVRLPSDGRVPIFRPGGFGVVGHAATVGPQNVAAGQTVNLGRTNLARVRIVGNNGHVILTGYTADLEAGTVHFDSIAGYSQPLLIEHRIEDMALVSDAQISGQVTFTRPLAHSYPAGSNLSSAFMGGDRQARVSVFFDQNTWDSVTWSDGLVGNTSLASYNNTLAPIEVTNVAALTERWVLRFTNANSFQVIGEHVGIIDTGSITADCAPINPENGLPYFTVRKEGWGSGWAAGNIVRMNTVGAEMPLWLVRTVQQGPNTGIEHSFATLTRGDVDRP